jgi:hypothetical protein
MTLAERIARAVWNVVRAPSGAADAVSQPQPAAENPQDPPHDGRTDAAPAPTATEAARRKREHAPGIRLDCGASHEVPHVGIVFVHGIGTQEAGATLLDWGSKIIGLLLDARAMQKAKGDPVIAVELDPGPSESRYIELQLPEAKTDAGHVVPEQHWVMAEAWWAQRVRPPAFGEMAEWLGPRGAIKRIVMAMLPRGRTEHDPRMRPAVEVKPLVRERNENRLLWEVIGRRTTKPVVKESGIIGSIYGRERERPIPIVSGGGNALSDVGTLLTKIGAGLYFQAISALILVVYGALRSIEKILPIGPLRNGTLTRPIDRFMLDWFGDVYVLLRDPAQAASVRGRLVDALNDLHANDCKSVVVVAHSGGAIVSYMTLADEQQKQLRVDRLITLGEGLNIAWRLTAGDDGVADANTKRRYNRLYDDMLQIRPDLKWDDFWASQDPAPVGVLSPPDAAPDPVPGAAPDTGSDLPPVPTISDTSLGRIHSHAVWNRLSFSEDHGTYWDNDEEFLIPMVRLLDQNPPGAKMFEGAGVEPFRSNRRRRRLSFLSIWRQLALVAPTAAIVIAFVRGSKYVVQAGENVAHVWDQLPGNELVSDPIDAFRKMNIANLSVGGFLAEAGVWVIAAVLALLTMFALLPPRERPRRWWVATQGWWHPFNFFALVLRAIPWIVGLPVVGFVAWAAIQFVQHATKSGGDVGAFIARAVVAAAVVAVLGYTMFGPPQKVGRLWPWLRDGIEMVVTIAVMVVVVVLALSPFLSILAFEEVGTTVLGCLTVIVLFQILGRIGVWRWNVWDGRERVAVRTRAENYPPVLRIFVQMTVLFATLVIAFLAVAFDGQDLTIAALFGAAGAVLLGVAVDVFDTARQQRRSPLDAMLQGSRRL